MTWMLPLHRDVCTRLFTGIKEKREEELMSLTPTLISCWSSGSDTSYRPWGDCLSCSKCQENVVHRDQVVTTTSQGWNPINLCDKIQSLSPRFPVYVSLRVWSFLPCSDGASPPPNDRLIRKHVLFFPNISEEEATFSQPLTAAVMHSHQRFPAPQSLCSPRGALVI